MSEPILFEEKQVRRIWYDEQWYFSVIDVCCILSESENPRRYWSDLKRKLDTEGASQLYEKIVQLKMQSADGKKYLTDCANAEGLLRIIQSIPSPKAEPFKRWLASVGYQRLQEIENPELASERMKDLYKQKGYPDEWIGLRMRGMAVRDTLTDEWKARGVDKQSDYAILTAEISKATFGMTPSEYKKYKALDKTNQNLRDHMNDLELIFTMLGEASTTEIARHDNAKGVEQNKKVAKRGGKIAGDARENLEKQTGEKVSTKDNFLHLLSDENNNRQQLK